MELKTLLTADYLDIIFDQRNKQYGGYELRRNYNSRARKALAFALTAMMAILTLSFISVNRNEKAAVPYHKPYITTDVIITPPKVIQPKVLPHTATATAAQVKTIKQAVTANLKIATDDQVAPDKIITKIKDMTSAQPGANDIPGDASIAPAGNGNGNGTGLASSGPVSPEILTYVSQMPAFDGDMSAYLNKHLKYPDNARENNIEGPVVVHFVVNEDGSVSNAAIIKSIGGGCDEEALRIINSMPGWKPGKQNGRAVKVWFSLVIRFELR